MFQSQMRSRSTCDLDLHIPLCHDLPVSISDEKPLHMRRLILSASRFCCSVSISDEKPLHMRLIPDIVNGIISWLFQSQMRSRSTCDIVTDGPYISHEFVSISDEKPLHMRRTPLPIPDIVFRSLNL